MLEPEPQDFRNANACLRGWTSSLRAADALHLAIASGRGSTLCSLDAPFVAAAQQLGLDAWLLSGSDAPAQRSSRRGWRMAASNRSSSMASAMRPYTSRA